MLADNPDRVDVKVLAEFKDFNNFRAPSAALSTVTAAEELVASDGETPEERIAKAAEELRAALSAELLDRVLEQSPEFFEQLVLDVLSAMGYGGGHAGAAERLGQTSDGGVDGVIYEDELGLDLIFVQAKRWKLDSTVGRPEIQKFVGALHGQGATKGVFITTSTFTKEAREYAEGVASRVILLEGRELANRMIDNDVGVAERGAFHLKRADLDYFHGSDD
ncbi:MAG: restriction endonuclease [Actinobacteria bacterium]|nr:restriction endonuclease [Actinomycetota bacterium]